MRKKKTDLTKGAIGPMLFRMALPMLLGMISMTIFNLVDTMYVGWLGTEELAALSFTFPVVLTLNSISMGIGMGASSVVSNLIGAGDHSRVRHVATDSMLLGLMAAAIIAVAGELTIVPLFTVMGASGQVLEFIVEYMRIWYPGILFVVIPMIGNNLIRATGDTKVPGLIMTAAAVTNIILDPIFIFGFGIIPSLGVQGAAVATLGGRSVAFTVSLIILIRRERMIDLKGITFSRMIHSWKEVLFVGIPSALTNIITPVSMGFITRLVASYGTTAVAGFGVGTRVEMLVLMVIMALASVLIPFAGQNRGAGRIDRVRRALQISYRFGLAWSALVFLLFLAFGRLIASLFNDNSAVLDTAQSYMTILALSYGFLGFLIYVSTTLNALRRPIHSLGLSITRMMVLYIPLAWIGSELFGLKGIFYGGATANVLVGLIALLVMRRQVGSVFFTRQG